MQLAKLASQPTAFAHSLVIPTSFAQPHLDGK
jgi:hypothetical protein